MGIGGHIHVEVVTEEITFPVGVPSPVTVRLGIMAFAVTESEAVFLTFTDSLFPLLRCGADRSAVPGKSQMIWPDQPLADGEIQKLLFIETENEGKRILRF